MRLTKQQLRVTVGVAGLLLLSAALGSVFLERANQPVNAEGETTLTAEATQTADGTATVETTPGVSPAEASTAGLPQPSYMRFARVASVGGTPLSYTVNLDFFEVLTGTEATQYAQQHGLTVPANGVLHVDADANPTLVPLKSDVAILYYTGGVEPLEQRSATPEQLRGWADGNAAAMPGALTDMWKVTVEQGIATRLEMVVIAD